MIKIIYMIKIYDKKYISETKANRNKEPVVRNRRRNDKN